MLSQNLNKTLLFLSLTQASLSLATEAPRADGQAINIAETDIWVTAPVGWEVLENKFGKALVIQEPKPEKPVYDKFTYQRNITVAVSHQGTPIDDTTVEELRTKILESFGRYGKDFTLAENHEAFDFKGQGDGILIYSFLKINKVQLTQAHVFVSGADKSLLMTYTDLSDRFHADQETFAKVWATLTTAHIEGEAPQRFEEFLIPGVAVSSGLFLLILISVIRSIRGRLAYRDDEDYLSDEGEYAEYQDDTDDDEPSETSGLALTSW
ncbi:hypothetical protein [Pseudobacteriovorax antillogorgiicola]|uniref:Uncharacterized protein n=1 Tax=Pseudobacteriovorax antillogorgiicola TaxID=1513793 RepID=A0A1Y6BR88_9BACT|nr:hypothetical protein [Pseudobacteriovorax antillogorgiicola]TCS53867.1 hypothetical protein EDD56_107176 [Pseudobacteriovorax antillogorgiicola]SMF21372.1 hypothetical protein SAMN06296036_10796 [Pseudobacteriovorax antillogorgiicola]